MLFYFTVIGIGNFRLNSHLIHDQLTAAKISSITGIARDVSEVLSAFRYDGLNDPHFFDILFFRVSFLIKLATSQASAKADTYNMVCHIKLSASLLTGRDHLFRAHSQKNFGP